MKPNLQAACRVVAERIMEWEIKSVKVYKSDHMLDDLLTGNGMVELMEKLRAETDISISLQCVGNYPWEWEWDIETKQKKPVWAGADTPEAALVLAAAQLVESGDAD